MHKIMLVEDDPQILEMMELLLGRIGYEPVIVPDVMTALELVRTSPPDLVLLDIMMVPVNGWEFLEKVREEYHSALFRSSCSRPPRPWRRRLRS